MGGMVNVAIRDQGQIFCRSLHTSQLVRLACSLDYWGGASALEHPLFREAVNSPSPLAPQQYGLAVLYFDAKWVGDVQGYSFLNEFSFHDLVRSNRGQREEPSHPTISRCFEESWRRGEISGVRRLGFDGRVLLKGPELGAGWISLKEAGLDQLDLKEIYAKLPRLVSQTSLMGFSFTPTGWTQQNFTATPKGLRSFIDALLDRNFHFDNESAESWPAFLDTQVFPGENLPHPLQMASERAQRSLEQSVPTGRSVRPSGRL